MQKTISNMEYEHKQQQHAHEVQQLRQQLQNIPTQQIPECLTPILNTLGNVYTAYHQSSESLQLLIDRLCDHVLSLKGIECEIENIKKQNQIDIILQQLLQYPHCQEIQINTQNEPILNKCRAILTRYFHLLVHYTTLKNIPKICVIFYKLVSLQMLDLKTINYFMLALTLSYENIKIQQYIKIIKKCLLSLYQKKVLYVGANINEISNKRKKSEKKFPINYHLYENVSIDSLSFVFITYVIYFGSSGHKHDHNHSQYVDLLMGILQYPVEVSSMVLSFRSQFPSSEVLVCRPDLQTISGCIIDSFFMKSLLTIYLDYNIKPQHKPNVYTIINAVVKSYLNVQIVRNMIKKLEIAHYQHSKQKWHDIFLILKATLPEEIRSAAKYLLTHEGKINSDNRSGFSNKNSPKKQGSETLAQLLQINSQFNKCKLQVEKDVLIFKRNSFLKHTISHQFTGFTLVFLSFRIQDEYMMFKLKNEQNQIWLMVRHIEKFLFQFSLIKLQSNVPVEMDKIQLNWNPFEKHSLQCKVQGGEIIFEFSIHENDESKKQRNSPIKHPESQQIGVLKQKNIKPIQIIIGSEDPAIPTYISELSTFNLKYCQGKAVYDFIFHKKGEIKQISFNVTTFTKSSLMVILKKVGDLDLFFLIVSHLVKKVEGQQALKEMLKEVIDFLEYLVVAKGVLGVKLSEQIKQHRFYNVKCLVYLASKYKRSPDCIFQIFRLLTIRGNKKPIQNLQILCNIGLWKQVPWIQHYKIIDRIRQNCGELLLQSSTQMMGFMKKIMLDFIIFYKNTQIQSESMQQELLIKHSQILKLVYDCVTEQRVDEILNYILFLLKLLHLMLDRTKNSGYIDTTIGFQITNLIYRLLFTIREQQYQSNTSSHPVKMMGSPQWRPIKTTKHGLLSSKSMNFSVGKQQAGNEELILMRIEQILYWTTQIIRSLNDQVLFEGETIKYYDWQWQYKQNKNNSSIYISSSLDGFALEGIKKKHKTISEIYILTLCQYIQMGLLSYNKNSFLLFSPVQLTHNQDRIFWEINLFDERISQERVLQALRYGVFEKIKWDEKKIQKVLVKSFEMIQNGSTLKLPEQLYQSMKTQNSNMIHNILISMYLEKCQEIDPIKKQKWAENIMYVISNLPDSFYTNTQLLREQLSKEKRNLKTLEIVEMHLIIKQLVREGFKLVKQLKSPCVQPSQQLKSTIFALYDSMGQSNQSKEQIQAKQDQSTAKTKSRKGSTNEIVVFGQLESVDFQQSFCSFGDEQKNSFITTQMLKKSLEHYRLLATPAEMQSFYKVSSLNTSQKQSKQQLNAHIQNFNINIDSIINILEQVSNQTSKISQLQNYIFFIDKHIYKFSKMILNQYLFQQIKLIDEKQRNKRKKSFKVVKNYKIKEEAENMLNQFLKERRISFYKMQKIWLNVEKNNKHLWELFFKTNAKHQSVDSLCSPMKLKGLIKIDYDRRQIQLPKSMTVLSNKFSISGTSQDKDTLKQGETDSSIFKDAAFYQQQQSSDRDKQETIKTTQKKDKQLMNIHRNRKQKNQFSVLYITTTVIYQGLISCEKQSIRFAENIIPDDNFYDNICANENERRSIFQIQKKREEFQIKINQRSTMIPKRYLYNDGAVQVYSENKTYFLVFRKGEIRDVFLKRFEHLKGVVSDEQKLKQLASKQAERWMNGDISNFTYLMHVNDLSGRTFNDMSQYYIFPWVLRNYQSPKFNKKFLRNEKNYRDLSKPIGAINPKRLEELLSRYKESLKYPQTQSYLYGSFCSNPAIVCNFMIRLEPFSMHHFLLQSKQFDLADRIFYSLASQFHGCQTNMGDYKELIPEFYSCPEFLRNRNKYTFGERQNKEQVNNVQLPPWARYEFGRKNKSMKKYDTKNGQFHIEDFFIFRMRKCLQSDIVTRNLNQWIDLFFGPYSRKEKAMERYNLYLPNIYKNQINKDKSKSKQGCRIFFKQFGQMPKQIFERDHKSFKNGRSYYKIRHSQASFISQIPIAKENVNRKYYANQKYIVMWDSSNINVVQIKNKSGFIQKNQSHLTQLPLNKNQKIKDLTIIMASINNGEDKRKIEAMLYLKQRKLRARQMTISTFRKKLELKQEQTISQFTTESQILKIYDEKNLILITEQNTIKIYEYSLIPSQQKSTEVKSVPSTKLTSLEGESISVVMNKRSQLRFDLKYEFTQHKSKIEHLLICESYGLAISIDSNRKVYVLKLNENQFEILQYFRLKKLTNCQFISQVQIHEMGYIIILTNLNCIHVFNLMGDFLITFNGNTLKNINQKMQTVRRSKGQNHDNKNNMQSRLDPNYSDNKINQRKRSGDNIEDTEKLVSCEFQQSDFESSNININTNTIIINEEQETKTVITQRDGSNSARQHFAKTEIITYFTIWNHQSGQLMITTDLGNIYRIDLFMMDDSQKTTLVNFMKIKDRKTKEKDRRKKSDDRILPSKFQFSKINRIGRHWQCWIITTNDIFKMQSEDYRNAQKRNEEYKKKYVLE